MIMAELLLAVMREVDDAAAAAASALEASDAMRA
jgi:hypothetical protein